MTGIFKFLNSEHVPKIMADETLRVCRQSYYRKTYETSGDEWIGDPVDGLSRLGVREFHLRDEARSENDERIAAMLGVHVVPGGGGVISITNSVSEAMFDDFIFCASEGDLATLKNSMCVASERNRQPYDACLRFVDLDQFYAVLGSAQFSIVLSGTPLEGMSANAFQGVRYTDNPPPIESYDHSPFIKRTIFEGQSEIRMTFEGDVSPDVETLYLKAPGLAACFEREF